MVKPVAATPAMGRENVRQITLTPEAHSQGRRIAQAPNSVPYMTGRCGFEKSDGTLCTNLGWKGHEYCFGHVRFENAES